MRIFLRHTAGVLRLMILEPKLMFKRVKMSATEVKDIYTKASIPSIDLQSIAVSIQRTYFKGT